MYMCVPAQLMLSRLVLKQQPPNDTTTALYVAILATATAP